MDRAIHHLAVVMNDINNEIMLALCGINAP
jgi:hypothetical protein